MWTLLWSSGPFLYESRVHITIHRSCQETQKIDDPQDLTSLYCSRSCNPRGIMATDNVPVMFHRLFSQSGAFICAPRPMRSLVRAPFKIGRNYGNAVDILRSANITNYHGRHTSELFFFIKRSLHSPSRSSQRRGWSRHGRRSRQPPPSRLCRSFPRRGRSAASVATSGTPTRSPACPPASRCSPRPGITRIDFNIQILQ